MIYDLRNGFLQELSTSDIVSYCFKKKKIPNPKGICSLSKNDKEELATSCKAIQMRECLFHCSCVGVQAVGG